MKSAPSNLAQAGWEKVQEVGQGAQKATSDIWPFKGSPSVPDGSTNIDGNSASTVDGVDTPKGQASIGTGVPSAPDQIQPKAEVSSSANAEQITAADATKNADQYASPAPNTNPAIPDQPATPQTAVSGSTPVSPDANPAQVTAATAPDTTVQPAAAPATLPEAPAPVIDPIQEAVNKLPQQVDLEAGSNPWNTSSYYLEQTLGRNPTPSEIMAVTKELCKSSNIAVPEWGIQGDYSHTKLPVGFKLNIDDNVKKSIFDLVKKA